MHRFYSDSSSISIRISIIIISRSLLPFTSLSLLGFSHRSFYCIFPTYFFYPPFSHLFLFLLFPSRYLFPARHLPKSITDYLSLSFFLLSPSISPSPYLSFHTTPFLYQSLSLSLSIFLTVTVLYRSTSWS